MSEYKGCVSTLAYCSGVELGDSPPQGCAIVTVNDKISAHLMLKGLIDPSKEVEKLNKKKQELKELMEEQEDEINDLEAELEKLRQQ